MKADRDSALVEVRIAPTVERNYKARGVFADVRAEESMGAVKDATGLYCVHLLPVGKAMALLEDAEQQARDRSLASGQPKAFTALRDQLRAAIKDAQGVRDDPGEEAARAMLLDSPALFKVGDRARYWSEYVDGKRDGEIVTIIEPFSLVASGEKNGPFESNGRRFAYRFGYVVRRGDGEEVFMCASSLRTVDNDIAHLKLVWAKPAPELSGWRRDSL